MRRFVLTFVAALGSAPALAGLDVPPAPAQAPDLSSYAKKTDLTGLATVDAVNVATSGSTTKSSSIPTDAPGAGKCRFTWVPSNLVVSGGVTGAAGKCSRIVQCGTSAIYVVQLFDIGDGC